MITSDEQKELLRNILTVIKNSGQPASMVDIKLSYLSAEAEAFDMSVESVEGLPGVLAIIERKSRRASSSVKT